MIHMSFTDPLMIQLSSKAQQRASVISDVPIRKSQVVDFRHATFCDQHAIRKLVRSERLNFTGLDWRNFLVAIDENGLAGAVQIRKHKDGSRELASLVVRADARGRGIGARLIEASLAWESGTVHMITNEVYGAYYAQWGFRLIQPSAAPSKVRHNYRLGRLARVISFLKGQPLRRLVILELPRDVVLRSTAPLGDGR